MTPLRIILSFFMIASVHQIGLAQEDGVREIGSIGSDIFRFINNLNNDIDSFFEREKAHKFNRQLRYFKHDLKKYQKTRKKLTDHLNANVYDIKVGKTKRTVKKLKRELDRLSFGLLRISPYVNSNLSVETGKMIDAIHNAILNQTGLYVAELDNLLEGKNINREKLKKDGDRIDEELVKSTELITIIQDKIKTKYKSTRQ